MSTTTTASERAELAKIALLVASEAAALAAGGYRSHPHADKKGRADLVTEFDRASEALVFERLGALAPEIPIVGEEATGDSDARQGLRSFIIHLFPADDRGATDRLCLSAPEPDLARTA